MPSHILDWRTLEDVRSRGCFVGTIPLHDNQRPEDNEELKDFAPAYSAESEAKDATFVVNRSDVSGDTNNGLISVPGWIRERAAEVFFEDGDVDAMSVVEVILACLTSVSDTWFLSFDGQLIVLPTIAAHRLAENDDLLHRRLRWCLYAARFHTSASHTAFTEDFAQRGRWH